MEPRTWCSARSSTRSHRARPSVACGCRSSSCCWRAHSWWRCWHRESKAAPLGRSTHPMRSSKGFRCPSRRARAKRGSLGGLPLPVAALWRGDGARDCVAESRPKTGLSRLFSSEGSSACEGSGRWPRPRPVYGRQPCAGPMTLRSSEKVSLDLLARPSRMSAACVLQCQYALRANQDHQLLAG